MSGSTGPERGGPRSSGAVLERNLECLLQRSYVAVRPREGFRRELLRDILAHVARPRLARVQRSSGARLGRRLAVAAGLLALITAGWLGLRGGARSSTEGLAEILARGQVAHRSLGEGPAEGAGGPWSAAPVADGRARLGLASAGIELVTPSRAAAEVSLSGGSDSDLFHFEARAGSRVALRVRPTRSATLDEGALELRSLGGDPLRLQSPEGSLEVLAGEGDFVLGLFAAAPVELVALGHDRPPPAAQGRRWLSVRAGEAGLALRLGTGDLTLVAGDELFLAGGAAYVSAPELGVGGARTQVDPPAAVASSAAGGAGGEPADPGGAAAFVGRVTDDQGQPVTRFTVLLLEVSRLPDVPDPVVMEVEDEDGRYAFPAEQVGRGPHSVFVKAPGWAIFRRDDLQLGEPDAEPPVVDARLEPGATVKGFVIDAGTQLPIEGALVVSENDAPVTALSLDPAGLEEVVSAFALTRADGSFELTHLRSTSHILRASHPDHAPRWIYDVQLRPGEVRGGVDFACGPGGDVIGRVEHVDGSPWEGVFLIASTTDFESRRPCLTYGSALTDEEGGFRVRGLPPGMTAVLNFGPADQVVGSGQPDMVFAQVVPGGEARADFLAPGREVLLRGVVYLPSGEPLGGASLMISETGASEPPQGDWRSTTTGPDGSYSFRDLAPGSHDLYFTGQPPDLVLLERVEITDELGEQVLDLHLKGGRLRGRVTDAVDDRPLPFTVVILFRAGMGQGDEAFVGRVFTDQDGRYSFDHLEPGAYAVHVYATAGSYTQQVQEPILVGTTGGPEDIDFALLAGGSLRLEVVDPEGQPVSGAELEFSDAEGRRLQFAQFDRTSDRGRYEGLGLPSGRVWMSVRRDGFVEQEVVLDFTAGQVLERRVRLQRP